MFTTSYKSPGMGELITALVKSVGAKKIIELGTQQGHSAVLLAKGITGVVKTYDTFETNYSNPPFKQTHADMLTALNNVKGYNVQVFMKDAFDVKPVKCDVLHIDICNHHHNVGRLLDSWASKVTKMIILEGGVYNKWQKKYGFLPYLCCLDVMRDWTYTVIRGEGDYAVTIMTRV